MEKDVGTGFTIVKKVIEMLDPKEAKSIEKAQNVFKDERIERDVVFISTHFDIIPTIVVYNNEIANQWYEFK